MEYLYKKLNVLIMHAKHIYRSRLGELANDHPKYRSRSGLTKKAIQRLTVGAQIAIGSTVTLIIYNSLDMIFITSPIMYLV